MSSVAGDIRVDGRTIRVSTPDRVLWPATGFTKRSMLDYLEAVAPVMLPHLAGRPITLRRAPEGVAGPAWYQTECRGAPDWLATVEVRGARGGGQRYCLIEEPAALLWAANRGALEFHPLPTTVERLGEPTALVLDLDPGPPATLVECCRVALRIRERLAALGLAGVVKTSGSLGLHVVVPLGRGHTFEVTKTFARALARELAAETPELVVASSTRAARRGRVFVDWVANDLVRSIVAPYSLRALEWPVVSTPLAWIEVEAAAERGQADGLWFLPEQVLARIDRLGDVFAGALDEGGTLPETATL